MVAFPAMAAKDFSVEQFAKSTITFAGLIEVVLLTKINGIRVAVVDSKNAWQMGCVRKQFNWRGIELRPPEKVIPTKTLTEKMLQRDKSN